MFTRRPSENPSSVNSSPTAGPSNYRGNRTRNLSDSQVISDSECFDYKEQTMVNLSSDEFDSDIERKSLQVDEETSDVSITSSQQNGAVSPSNSVASKNKKISTKRKQNKPRISSNSNAASSALAAIGVVASSVAASSFSFADVFSPSLSTSNSGKEKETKKWQCKKCQPFLWSWIGSPPYTAFATEFKTRSGFV